MSGRGVRAGLALLGATGLALGGAAALGAGGGASPPSPRGAEVRMRGLAAAAAWSDALGAHRAPAAPAPGATERLILVLRGAPASWTPPARRAEAVARIRAAQDALRPEIAAMGGTVTARWSVVLAGMAVEVPAGHGDALAGLPGVAAVAPVRFLAPAARSAGPAGRAGATPPPGLPAPAVRPAHLALVDTGIDPRAPQLGGGMGPTFPVIGGRDLVDGDDDPTVGASAPAWEAHGTQMAGLVIGAPALDGLPPARVPRLLAYRVVAEETVDGRPVPLARSDRVVSALEGAVDPDGDGSTADGAQVVLLGLAGGFAGGGDDPVAEAVRGATRAGAIVVAPSGNDGPTYARLGSLGQPAASAPVLTVGGLADARTPRTGHLRVGVGPAAATLGPLPLLGPSPAAAEAPLVVLPGPGGAGAGATAEEWRAAAASGLDVRGAMVIVTRGGAGLTEKAALARDAGASALVVWDRGGTGLFPSGAADGGPGLPVLGVGSDEGAALAALVARQGPAPAAAREDPPGGAPQSVASFSSTGPTADGRLKPDLVAPAVNVPSAWPPGPGGGARTATMTGTSAAAAQAAALALRLRIDRPALRPAVVRALLVSAATPVPGVRLAAQGAGVLRDPGRPPAVLLPPLVSAPAGARGPVVAVVVQGLSHRAARYRLGVASASGTPLGDERAVAVRPGGRVSVRLRLPAGRRSWSGRVVLRDGAGAVVVAAPAATFTPRPARPGSIGAVRVRTTGGATQAVVRIGRRARLGDRIWSDPLHDVRVQLVPSDGSAPLDVAGLGGRHDWTPGVYRFVVARRLPSGGEVPAAVYRLRVAGVSPDGIAVARDSRSFTLR